MTPVVLFVSLRVFKKTSGNGGVSLHLWICVESFHNLICVVVAINGNSALDTLSWFPFLLSHSWPSTWGRETMWTTWTPWTELVRLTSSVCVCVCAAVDNVHIICNTATFTDGVVKLNPADFKDRKGKIHKNATSQAKSLCDARCNNYTLCCHVLTVFVQLACAFRYGSDDLDVMGLCFRKDIWIQIVQIYPATDKPTLTAMHDTLLKKAGDDAVPFSFEVCHNVSCYKCKEFKTTGCSTTSSPFKFIWQKDSWPQNY